MDENINEKELDVQESNLSDNNQNIDVDNNRTKKRDFKPLVLYIVIQLLVGLLLGMFMGYSEINSLVESGVDISQMTSQELSSTVQSYDTNTLSVIITNISFFILFTIFMILYHKNIKEDTKKISSKMMKMILATFGIVFVANIVTTMGLSLFGIVSENQTVIDGYLNSFGGIGALLCIIFLGPVVEEFVFRYSLGTIFKNNAVFLIVSSILFGLIHGIGIATLQYVVIGLLLGLLYLKTDKNIVACSIVHCLNNGFALILNFVVAMMIH